MSSNINLSSDPLFLVQNNNTSVDERVALSYRRARLVLVKHGANLYNSSSPTETQRNHFQDLSPDDVVSCSPKFWELHSDPILPLDIACFIIVTGTVNLAVGTIARYLPERPDLLPVVQSLLRLDTAGVYLISERGHGLDTVNIETTATMTANGFVLNTPREEAIKFMPATTPLFGIPKVAVVVARLIIDNRDQGLRSFVVPICDKDTMHEGVRSFRLPARSGTSPLDFALTSFQNVKLPRTALLGLPFQAATDISPRIGWWNEIWRIPLGSMAVAAPLVQAIKHAAFIGGKHSIQRMLVGKGPNPTPIISFPTQQWPIVHAIAVSFVMESWYKASADLIADREVDPRVKHGIAIVVKATVCRHFQQSVEAIAERCGAQGTFERNFMAQITCDAKGIVIADGDVLTLSIRLFSEILQKRYTLLLPAPSSSLLARHAHDLLDENVHLLSKLVGGHRSEDYQYSILPRSEHTITAFGHALAYEAARKSNVPKELLDVYECGVIRLDSAWYVEHGMGRQEQATRDIRALRSAMPHLNRYLSDLGIEEYVRAMIVEKGWMKNELETLTMYERAPMVAAAKL